VSGATRVLAIDLGDRRIGLAVSDDRGSVRGLSTLGRSASIAGDAERLKVICTESRVEQLAVGLPLHSDGRWSEQAEATHAWAVAVAHAVSLPVCFVDERYSSERAAQLVGRASRGSGGGPPGPVRREAHRAALDQAAARLILEDYANPALVISVASAEALAGKQEVHK